MARSGALNRDALLAAALAAGATQDEAAEAARVEELERAADAAKGGLR